jgi:hypothetical protein
MRVRSQAKWLSAVALTSNLPVITSVCGRSAMPVAFLADALPTLSEKQFAERCLARSDGVVTDETKAARRLASSGGGAPAAMQAR